MRNLAVVVVVITLCLMPGCRSGNGGGESFIRAGFDFSTVDVVAVVDVGGAIESENIKDQIADSFLKQMLKKGYGPVGRQLVKRQLSESNVQIQDLKGEAYAVEAGRILKVPAVLIIDVPNFGEETSITAKIIEVNTGSALWIGSGAVSKRRGSWLGLSDEDLGLGGGGGIFNSSQGPYTTSEEQKKKEQQRRALQTLTVRESKDIEKVVKDICASLPYRSPDLKPKDHFFKMPQFSTPK
jgi:hypothetical protein